MGNRPWCWLAMIAWLVPLAGCGGGSHAPESSFDSSQASSVTISGRISQRGTPGPLLVFAYTDLAAGDDPARHEPAAVGTVAADGAFDLDLPAAASLTLVFLADAADDGAVDEGDPIAVLRNPDLVELQGGDQVRIADAKIDFTSHRVDAAVDVTRAPGNASPPGATADPTS